MDVFTLAGKLTLDGADKVQSQLKGTVDRAAQAQKALKLVGAALTAVGAAGLAMVASTKKINAELATMGLTIGLNAKEMRGLVLDVTNVTFGLESVKNTFDLLIRAGVENSEMLKASANAFDALADATGNEASALAGILIPAFKNFGEALPTTSAELDKFTWLTKNTQIELAGFGSMMSYVAQYGADLDITLEDMIGILAALDAQGKSSSTITKIFRTAVTQAASGVTTFNDALGLTQGEIDGYKTKMDGANGLTKESADLMNEQFTIMDKLKQKWAEITLGASGFLEPLEPILAGMTALGPLMIFLSTQAGIAAAKWTAHAIAVTATNIALAFTNPLLIVHKVVMLASVIATHAATAATWLWNAALTVATGGINLIIPLIAALIAGIVLLVANFDKVKRWWKGLWGDNLEVIKEYTEEEIKLLNDNLAKQKAIFSEQVKAAQDTYKQEIDDLRDKYGVLEDYGEEHNETLMDAARRLTEEQRDELDKQMDAARDAHEEKLDLIQDEYDAAVDALDIETSSAIASLKGQLSAIDAAKAAEDDAREATENKDKEASLRDTLLNAETDEAKAEAQLELDEFLEKLAEDKKNKDRQRQKDSIRDQIAAVRASAAQQRKDLQRQLAADKDAEQAALEGKLTNLQTEQDALDAALQIELVRIEELRVAKEEASQATLDSSLENINEEMEAFVASLDQEREEVAQFVIDYNAELDKLQDKTVVVNIVTNQVGGETSSPSVQGYASGGRIDEPTWLTKVGETQPYGIMSEKGPEYISPSGGTGGAASGFKTANITLEIDGRTLARAMGQPLIEEIRLKTGIKV